MGLKKFTCINDIPEFPLFRTSEEYKKFTKECIEAGAICKKDLIKGAYYVGSCRNSGIALWTGKEFIYIREKIGYYIDHVNHFEDDDGYDLFIPLKMLDYENY